MNRLLFFTFLILAVGLSLFAEEHESPTGQDLYSKAQYPEAAAWFLSRSFEKKDRAVNFYNAARCFHQDYLENRSPESIERAIDGYYRALEIDPGMIDAKKNLELARKEQEKNKMDQESRHESSENQASKENDPKMGNDSLSDMADKQKQLSESDSSEENRKEQEQLRQQTRDSMDKSKNQKQKEALEKALEKQNEALDKMEHDEDQEARQAQKSAAEYLEKASAADNEGDGREKLSQDLQNLLNQEQSRKRKEESSEDFMRVEKNW